MRTGSQPLQDNRLNLALDFLLLVMVPNANTGVLGHLHVNQILLSIVAYSGLPPAKGLGH